MANLSLSLSLIFRICAILLLINVSFAKTLKRDMKALNEVKRLVGWRLVYSWVGDDPCGDGILPPWSGVTCSTVGDYRVVIKLEVYSMSIVGNFPKAVTKLLDLTVLDLHNNKLTGPIPSEIGKLKRLKTLNLRWNKLQYVLPPEIGGLKSITSLYLSFNNFRGEIPKELANLDELQYLHIQENHFTGRIPAELGTLQKLRHLDAGNNNLVGSISDLFRIEGCFPALRNLFLNNNSFTGGLPNKLANLTNLEILYLSYNKMTGAIPAALANIPRLTNLHLDHNLFNGSIPEAFYKHPNLKDMYIEGNAFKPDVKAIGAHQSSLAPYFSLKMDTLIKQTRRKHPASQEKLREVGSSTRETKVPARKSVSFKEEKKKSSNWLQKQFSRQMSGQSYDPIGEMDHAAAVAATAYAIATFEETWLENYHSGLELGPSSSRSKNRSEERLPLEEPRSLSRRFSGQLLFIESETKDHKQPKLKSPLRKSSSVKKTFSMNLRGDHTKQSEESEEKHDRQRKPVSEPPRVKLSLDEQANDDKDNSKSNSDKQATSLSLEKVDKTFTPRIQPPLRTRSERRAPPPLPPPPPLSPSPLRLPPRETKRQSSEHTSRKDDSTANAWEIAELAKIKARYEKLNRKIDLWEAKKREKARRKLDMSEQSELEQRRKRGLQRFREDTEYIEQIAAGARAQAEKDRQSKEFKVKEKAGVIRSTGKLPGKACCF
ncbi:unnamed protein product [Arabidopsis arenosa]|uniref:Uncharacterized protein n=1 Tax=Arabidopsis arenosa TaxID=38785 RepID=A0A8S1ZHH0_ARAAE|nr:unnamed protein product [Arabidopsis arenosa]